MSERPLENANIPTIIPTREIQSRAIIVNNLQCID